LKEAARHPAVEETEARPKPMIEIGKPIIWHIMKIYRHGVNEFVVCLGYKGYCSRSSCELHLHETDVTFDISQNTMEVHHPSRGAWQVRSSIPAPRR
jgi:glucose-1-phosphate cytidylyltransferase